MLVDSLVAQSASRGTPTLAGASEGANPLNVDKLTGMFSSLAGVASSIYTTVKNQSVTPNTVVAQSTVNKPNPAMSQDAANAGRITALQQKGWKEYLPWIVGGIAVIVLVMVFMRRS